MSRPYKKKSIQELEEIYSSSKDNIKVLLVLQHELSHRKVPRAVKLKIKVDQRIEELSRSNGQSSQEETPIEDARQGGSRTQGDRESSGVDEDRYPFSLIKPVGTKPRPQAFRPKPDEDLKLDFSPDDSEAKIFRIALKELIAEMKARKVGNRFFTLEDGERLKTEFDGNVYQFSFLEEANLFEGAKVDLGIGGRYYPGNLVGLLQGQILISLQNDFGPKIAQCTLKVDNTLLLQALHDRLEKVEKNDVHGFRSDFAKRVLLNEGKENPVEPMVHWPWKKVPNANQSRFVQKALANEIVWLFGPPGTGKTDTLSALAWLHYLQGKRILICSNTNHAVDQLLLKLWVNLSDKGDVAAFENGNVLRLGNLAEDLEGACGDLIIPERVAAKKSESLILRKQVLEAELGRMAREVADADVTVKLYAQLAVALKAFEDVTDRKKGVQGGYAKLTNDVNVGKDKLVALQAELERRQTASIFGRIFQRNEEAIKLDIEKQKQNIADKTGRLEKHASLLVSVDAELSQSGDVLAAAKRVVQGRDKANAEKVLSAFAAASQKMRDEIAEINRKLEDIRLAVLREARIVGATVTRVFLRPTEFASFDVVLVDEASMILLPAVYLTVGIVTEKVVISGDPQQISPILQTNQRCLTETLGKHVFARAGIDIQTARKTARLELLQEQFRMDDAICQIVSKTFYRSELLTSPKRPPMPFAESSPLIDRLMIVDTSKIWPFTTRNSRKSRLNLMHGLAVRNLILHLKDGGRLWGRDGNSRIGVTTPYAAQAELIKKVLKSHGVENDVVRVGTVHSFQGDERELMVIDLVDSIGERYAGVFLQAEDQQDAGAKLLNVALSRAKEGVVIFANLTFLDQKLPSYALLRGILHEIQQRGKIVDVKEILSLRPILDDLRYFNNQPELDPECLKTGLFNGRDFAKLCRLDMESATKSIVVFSGFITPERSSQMGEVFRKKISEGVKVRCITRPPYANGSIPEELGRSALSALEGIGVAIDLRSNIHEKAVIIDGKIVWFGSLNPLSHTSKTSELMARMDNEGVASHVASILSIKKRSADALDPIAFATSENPRCGKCKNWSVLIKGPYGLFFGCMKDCGWKQSIDGPIRN